MPYELIDHTADIGIRATGRDIKDLFETAARAMYEQIVDTAMLIAKHRKGLTLVMAKQIYQSNQARYDTYRARLKHTPQKLAVALFNAFLMDYERRKRGDHVAPYAAKGAIQ